MPKRASSATCFLTGLFGTVAALFTGWFFIAGMSGGGSSESKADIELVEKAEADVDAWEKAFGLRSSRVSG